jgi:hypothetical protein
MIKLFELLWKYFFPQIRMLASASDLFINNNDNNAPVRKRQLKMRN